MARKSAYFESSLWWTKAAALKLRIQFCARTRDLGEVAVPNCQIFRLLQQIPDALSANSVLEACRSCGA